MFIASRKPPNCEFQPIEAFKVKLPADDFVCKCNLANRKILFNPVNGNNIKIFSYDRNIFINHKIRRRQRRRKLQQRTA